MNPTIDGALKALSNAVKKLEMVETRADGAVKRFREQARNASLDADAAEEERERAARIRNRLAELLE